MEGLDTYIRDSYSLIERKAKIDPSKNSGSMSLDAISKGKDAIRIKIQDIQTEIEKLNGEIGRLTRQPNDDYAKALAEIDIYQAEKRLELARDSSTNSIRLSEIQLEVTKKRQDAQKESTQRTEANNLEVMKIREQIASLRSTSDKLSLIIR